MKQKHILTIVTAFILLFALTFVLMSCKSDDVTFGAKEFAAENFQDVRDVIGGVLLPTAGEVSDIVLLGFKNSNGNAPESIIAVKWKEKLSVMDFSIDLRLGIQNISGWEYGSYITKGTLLPNSAKKIYKQSNGEYVWFQDWTKITKDGKSFQYFDVYIIAFRGNADDSLRDGLIMDYIDTFR